MCLCFPDAYSIGTSHHGLQVLYTIMNDDPQWACERAFAPWQDFEAALRKAQSAACTAWKPSRRCATSTYSVSLSNTKSVIPTF